VYSASHPNGHLPLKADILELLSEWDAAPDNAFFFGVFRNIMAYSFDARDKKPVARPGKARPVSCIW